MTLYKCLFFLFYFPFIPFIAFISPKTTTKNNTIWYVSFSNSTKNNNKQITLVIPNKTKLLMSVYLFCAYYLKLIKMCVCYVYLSKIYSFSLSFFLFRFLNCWFVSSLFFNTSFRCLILVRFNSINSRFTMKLFNNNNKNKDPKMDRILIIYGTAFDFKLIIIEMFNWRCSFTKKILYRIQIKNKYKYLHLPECATTATISIQEVINFTMIDYLLLFCISKQYGSGKWRMKKKERKREENIKSQNISTFDYRNSLNE